MLLDQIGGNRSTLNGAMRISAAGLNVERFRVDTSSANLANAHSEATLTSLPYRRHLVQIVATPDGPRVTAIPQDMSSFPMKKDPGNPAANANGEVAMSNVEPMNEMVDMISASRAYEANIEAFNTAKSMIRNALNIGKA